ncbi:hypothetical protein EVAR_47025_1 [Eumeta japonica]|uniref:Uncharacterized protein n=1 Tax=Eumeta variegata TaxID=151549 RepID=A0A4C1XGP4_EUMVA|nr:hypothetical protein EVAR_47025_1 [Eumeta japonica]
MNELIKELKDMKAGKAAGYDRVLSEMLRGSAGIMASLLFQPFNKCWKCHRVPNYINIERVMNETENKIWDGQAGIRKTRKACTLKPSTLGDGDRQSLTTTVVSVTTTLLTDGLICLSKRRASSLIRFGSIVHRSICTRSGTRYTSWFKRNRRSRKRPVHSL